MLDGHTRIADALAGRRVAVTGATGFLGTALVERLLRCVPDCEVVVVVRPGRRGGAAERVRRDLVRNDCFDRLRSELGGRFDAELERRLVVVAGDVGVDGLGLDAAGREVLARCDAVVHAAATVSFDAPLDTAVEVNLLGPVRVAELLGALRPENPAHLVAVSTAYVAGFRRGEVHEDELPEPPDHASWRAEVVAARRARDDADAESRRPEHLERFGALARRELGAAGTAALAARAERLRREWVERRLVELGRTRARALGWPDAYAFTKALGERALCEVRGPVPVTILRPSIIESSLAEPRPGWIRGFRMAEPVIVSYARGLLAQFPGVPEGVIDVVPVDLVAAALLAVVADGPPASGPAVYHVASGTRNPLRYGELVDLVRAFFEAHPLYDAKGQAIAVPEFGFPGRGTVVADLRRATALLDVAERVTSALPRGLGRDLKERLEERRRDAERALGYVELYGAYAETEARFCVDRLLELSARLHPEDARRFVLDPAAVDWRSYVHDVHLPSVVKSARVRTSPPRRAPLDRASRSHKALLEPGRRLVVFDLEHTLVASNVVESYAWLAAARLAPAARAKLALALVAEAPRLLSADRRDRSDFLRAFYRRYEGAPADELRELAAEAFSQLLLTRAFPSGLARVRRHREAGHRTVLVTGALDFVVAPFGPLFDHVIAARLLERDGRFTGELAAPPPTGEARAEALAAYAAAEGLELAASVAYADSTSDLPLLEAVGHPVAVNPDHRLARIARRRGWPVEHWSLAPGGAARLLPLPAPDAGLLRLGASLLTERATARSRR